MLIRGARVLLCLAFSASAALAASGVRTQEIVITHVGTRSGPAGLYGTQAYQGFMLGLEYATGGKMEVAGRKIRVIDKDDQGNPNTAKSLVTAAYADDKSDIVVGPTLSASALAALPAAEEAKKILLVDGATADTITGSAWNRYVFRTARTSTHDSVTTALAMPSDVDASVAILTADTQYGRDSTKALKEALAASRPRIKVIAEELAPQATTDFTAPIQRTFDALKAAPGRKFLYVFWAVSAVDPVAKIMAMQPERLGIEVYPPGQLQNIFSTWRNYTGLIGQIYYQFTFPKNKANDWLVQEYSKRNGRPPDFFVPGGMIAAAAVVDALKKTNGKTDTESLISALEGLTFESAKGKMTIRKEDHQAMQEMYIWRIRKDATDDFDFVDLVRTIPAEEINIPIRNKR